MKRTRRIIVNIGDNIAPEVALARVLHVVSLGRYGEGYLEAKAFESGEVVHSETYKTGTDSFRVRKERSNE